MGGDFNVSVDVLVASGWLKGVHGRVQAPLGGTCRSAEGRWSTIDYFVVSRQLAQAVEAVHAVGSEPPKPHLPIRLQLNRSPRSFKEWTLKRVKQFPLVHPIGCSPKPPEWPRYDMEPADTVADTAAAAAAAAEELVSQVHSSFVNGLELELCGVFDLIEEERPQYCGIGATPTFRWRQACEAISGSRPASDASGRAWRFMQRRLEDLELALRRGSAAVVAKALAKAAAAFHVSASACGFSPLERYKSTGRWRGLLICGLKSQVEVEVGELVKHCTSHADRIEKAATQDRRKDYRAWAASATKNGGGAAHAFTKIPTGWVEAVVPVGAHPSRQGMGSEGISSDPQKVVAAELSKWCGTWQATDEPAAPLPPWPVTEQLTPVFGEQIRKVGTSFRWLTGLGLDQIHPRHLSLVSDGCLRTLAFLFHMAEACGRWADPMSFFSFFLLAKPTGGVSHHRLTVIVAPRMDQSAAAAGPSLVSRRPAAILRCCSGQVNGGCSEQTSNDGRSGEKGRRGGVHHRRHCQMLRECRPPEANRSRSPTRLPDGHPEAVPVHVQGSQGHCMEWCVFIVRLLRANGSAWMHYRFVVGAAPNAHPTG